jgi:glycolate oxidase
MSDLSNEFLTLHEFVKEAKKKVTPNVWDYLVGGTETETTLKRNRMAIDRIALRPRVLRDVSKIDASTTFLGHKTRLPVLIAPVGALSSMHSGAGMPVAEGAARFGIPMMLSSVNGPQMEKIAEFGGVRMFQLYVRGDDAFVDDHIERAMASGNVAFCFTVDSAIYSRRERDIAKRFDKPWRAGTDTSRQWQAALSWKDIARVRKKYKIPLVVKGIGTAEDAIMAVEHGVEVVYVSNHGGRQLDHGRGSLDVLPEVVDAVKGKATIIVDGGFTRGTDFLKAMALGADIVGIGRLFCYALASAGADGIVRMLEILENEIQSALGLCGVTSFAELDRSYLHFNAPIVTDTHVHSAFPLLDLDDPGYGGR